MSTSAWIVAFVGGPMYVALAYGWGMVTLRASGRPSPAAAEMFGPPASTMRAVVSALGAVIACLLDWTLPLTVVPSAALGLTAMYCTAAATVHVGRSGGWELESP